MTIKIEGVKETDKIKPFLCKRGYADAAPTGQIINRTDALIIGILIDGTRVYLEIDKKGRVILKNDRKKYINTGWD